MNDTTPDVSPAAAAEKPDIAPAAAGKTDVSPLAVVAGASPAADPAAKPAPVLALPPPQTGTRTRVLALTEAGVPLTRAFARIVQALRDAGSEVVPLALPRAEPAAESVPTLTELKRGMTAFAKDLVRGLRGAEAQSGEPWIVSQLRAVEGRIDAVLGTDPEVARAVFPYVDRVFAGAPRIGIDADYHLDPEWKGVEFDAIVVAHPGLGSDLPRVREGRARSFIGGPITAGAETAAKRLDDTLPQVVVSCARLDPGDVDSLLFQLSLVKPSASPSTPLGSEAERFSLLFLPSQRPGVDELVRARAGIYGLRGKRPRDEAEGEAWIRGAALIVGFPSPAESATAVAAGVPILFVAAESRLLEGDRFLVQRGALIAEVPITIAVHVEGLLPGGAYRVRAEESLRELGATGPEGAAKAVLAAVKAGRPDPAPVAFVEASRVDDGLEDIGIPQAGGGGTAADLPLAIRRAYLKEIILQQHSLERNQARAKGGLDTWQRRVRLARVANEDALADKAIPRVEGLLKMIDQLERELRDVKGLRERFASPGPLTAADRAAAARYLSPGTAASIDRGEAPDSAFTKLEIEDALAALKRKIDGH